MFEGRSCELKEEAGEGHLASLEGQQLAVWALVLLQPLLKRHCKACSDQWMKSNACIHHRKQNLS